MKYAKSLWRLHLLVINRALMYLSSRGHKWANHEMRRLPNVTFGVDQGAGSCANFFDSIKKKSDLSYL